VDEPNTYCVIGPVRYTCYVLTKKRVMDKE
jgi:hypothetical protein